MSVDKCCVLPDSGGRHPLAHRDDARVRVIERALRADALRPNSSFVKSERTRTLQREPNGPDAIASRVLSPSRFRHPAGWSFAATKVASA